MPQARVWDFSSSYNHSIGNFIQYIDDPQIYILF